MSDFQTGRGSGFFTAMKNSLYRCSSRFGAYSFSFLFGTVLFTAVSASADTPEVDSDLFAPITSLAHQTALRPGASALFDMIQYMVSNTSHETPEEILATIPRYNRVEMFGTWVNENAPDDCYNTRAEVLRRDATSLSKIRYSSTNPCQVSKGEWDDPYSGKRYKLANAIQVDHVVALKNAYRSGAYAWSRERRCHYANYLADSRHLIAVSGHENMSKGDAGPERYLPPNQEFVCEYLGQWLTIKATWNLGFTEEEADSIRSSLADYGCDIPTTTRLSTADLQARRAATMRMNTRCAENEFEEKTDVEYRPIPRRGGTH